MDNASGHGLIDYVVVYGLVIYAIWAALTKNNRILYIMPACLTFYFFIPLAGSWVTPYKLVPPIFLLVSLLSNKSKRVHHLFWFYALCLVFLLSSIVGIFYNFVFDFSESWYSPTKRIIIQSVSNINLLCIYLLLKKECYNTESVIKFFEIYIYTTTILCVYGIYQYFAMKLGLPYRGIVYTSESTGSAIDLDNLLFRINSFANEPKRLSYMLGVGAVLLISARNYWGDSFIKLNQYIIILLAHVSCIFLTYATSIYVILLLFFVINIIISLFYQQIRIFNKYLIYFCLLVSLTAYYNWDRLKLLYELRVTVQFEELQEAKTVRIEKYAFEFVQKNPEYLILGVGVGMYNFFIDKEFGVGYGTSPIGVSPIDSGMLNLVLDYGILGSIIIFLPFLRLLLTNRKSYKQAFGIPILLFLICVASTLDPWEIYFAFCGVLEGMKKI